MPPIAVIAGGLATRLGKLTAATPKSMLMVADAPFVAHQLRLFRREGISRVVMCVGHLSGRLLDYVGDGRQFGVEVVYSEDGETLLGTGAALRKALSLLGPEFLVTYGDSYLDIAFGPVVDEFRRRHALALMTVLHNQGRWDTSNVEFADGWVVSYSKKPNERMQYIDFGLSCLKADVFAGTPDGTPFDLGTLYGSLVSQGEMAGYLVDKRFYEIGSHAGLTETDAYIRAQREAAGRTPTQ